MASAPAPAPPPPSSPASGQAPATKNPPAVPPPDLALATNPFDALLPSVAPPPSPFFDPPYVKAGQVALRCFLGCSNAMGLEFKDDCCYYLRLDITTPAMHLASPLYIVFDYCNHHLDAIAVAALLQAALGGSATDFFVAKCSPLIFRFHVASARVAELILAQSTIRHRNYSFSFARTLPPLPPPSHSVATCMSIAQLLQILEDLGLDFEGVAWAQCRSSVSIHPPNQPHGFRMYAHVIQFPFALDTITLGLILASLFGGVHHQFNVTDNGDSYFSFTVASTDVATRIASMGDFRKLGMLIRFPWPLPMGGARRSPSGVALPSSFGATPPSPSAVDPTILPSASTTLDLPKERRQRPGISSFYRLVNC
ncbi:uncharacterized protein [Aegilops tauschii subsp. strangulata]|uniref:uncharacterized protein n=1 Tax=Aegilops tauschii subsp. strangulata TaxID=200361 RepID=UPI001ABC351D|nr:uncharacterized protein LOC109739688 [Aegilops tauschii subsp. strangulata]